MNRTRTVRPGAARQGERSNTGEETAVRQATFNMAATRPLFHWPPARIRKEWLTKRSTA